MRIPIGLAGRAVLVVTEADTATAMGSGDVPVLGTPRLIALCEEASCRALDDELEPGTTSVGWRVQFDHLAPTAVGGQVVVDAVLERVEGRRLTFALSASDASGLVGAGKVTRVLVDVESFLRRPT
ncbi:MAG: thioesterase family protein [Acidimicrobiales bacterium]